VAIARRSVYSALGAFLVSMLSIVDCATKRTAGPSHEAPLPPLVVPDTLPSPALTPLPAQKGIASWYGPGFDGRETANGEMYDQDAMTAAHPSLPFGTRVRVTRLATGRSVVVRINDRGPYVEHRVIDLSRAAGAALGLMRPGIAPVRLEIVGRGPRRSMPPGDGVVQ
jgi:peptidoglycan lytic transglycosylase